MDVVDLTDEDSCSYHDIPEFPSLIRSALGEPVRVETTLDCCPASHNAIVDSAAPSVVVQEISNLNDSDRSNTPLMDFDDCESNNDDAIDFMRYDSQPCCSENPPSPDPLLRRSLSQPATSATCSEADNVPRRRKKRAVNPEVVERKAREARVKMLRKAEREKLQSEKPDECLGNMTILLDGRLDNLLEIATLLQEKCPQLTVSSGLLPVPKSVMWQLEELEHRENDEGGLVPIRVGRTEPFCCLLPSLSEFLEMASRHSSDQPVDGWNLVQFIGHAVGSLEKAFPGQADSFQLFTMVTWMECYLANLSTIRKRAKQVSKGNNSTDIPQPGPSLAALSNISTVVSREQLISAVADVSLVTHSVIRWPESLDELTTFLCSYSRSIAGIPSKSRKDDTLDFKVFVDKKLKSVKVGKDGTGALQCWKQMLMQFGGLTEDVALAITKTYPTPKALLRAYDCAGDGEKLLEDIQITRGTGVVATKRRLGRAMSKRIYVTFTAVDGATRLDST